MKVSLLVSLLALVVPAAVEAFSPSAGVRVAPASRVSTALSARGRKTPPADKGGAAKVPTKGLGALIDKTLSIDPTIPRLSPASDMRVRSAARKAGKPLPPVQRGGKVENLAEEDREKNSFAQGIGFAIFGGFFVLLELETLLNGQTKGALFPDLYTEWNYSGTNDAICAKEKAQGIDSAVCSEWNLSSGAAKKGSNVVTTFPKSK